MKFKQVVLSMTLSMLVAATANAGTTWLGLDGGVGFPTGEYKDAAATGWHAGVDATQSVNDTWGFGGDVGFHRWGGSDDLNAATETLFGPGSEISWSAIQATAHATANFPSQSQVKPYAKAGLGLYSVTSKLESPSGNSDANKSKFGFNLGGGMNFQTQSNMQWGLVGAYHIIQAKDDFGADLNFATLGLNIRWGVSR